MKKFTLFLSFCLIFTAIIVNFPNNGNSNIVYAQNESRYISVVGRAELEKQADYAEIGFCIQNTSNSYNDTQSKINNILENLESKLKTIDENLEIFILNCNCKPFFAKNNSYSCICNFVVKTKCLDCIDKILEVAGNNEISCFNGINYILENKQEVLDEVYKLASEDADKKALNISQNAKLIDSNSYKQLRMPFSNTTQKIRVQAKVKNIYEVLDHNYVETTDESNDLLQEQNTEQKDTNLNHKEQSSSETSSDKSDKTNMISITNKDNPVITNM